MTGSAPLNAVMAGVLFVGVVAVLAFFVVFALTWMVDFFLSRRKPETKPEETEQ